MFKVIDLSQEDVETKRNDAKLMDRNNELVMELDGSRVSECLTCDRIQNAESCIKTLEEHVKTSDSRYSKAVKDADQVEKELNISVASLDSALQVEKDCIARFEGVVSTRMPRIEMFPMNSKKRAMP